MSTFSPRFLDEIRTRLTLSELIGKRIKITRAGREFKGCCPFHKEKTPSFYVNDDKQFYHCFGCGAHGDAIGFTMQHDNLSFPEAVETLAALAGLEVPKSSPEEKKKAKEEKSLYTLLEDTTKFFEANLYDSQNADALGYMKDRGMSDEFMAAYRIGYAPDDGRELIDHLKKSGYTDQQMVDTGVARISQKSNKPYAFFRDRIIFPVADKRGRIVAFGGRVLPEHLRPHLYDNGQKPPKYINSIDSVLFHKGRMLYGESHAKHAAMEDQPVIVVEGYVDVIACAKAGFKGAVAPLGTALTEDQILLLWKMIPANQKNPILCFDGDNAGRRAAERAVERVLPHLKPDQSVRLAFLPQGEDPDSLIKIKGKKAFQEVLDQALPLVEFIWQLETTGREITTPEERAGLSKSLYARINQITDRSVQHYYKEAIKDKVQKKFSADKKSNNYGSGYNNTWKKDQWKNKGQKKPAFNAPIKKPSAAVGNIELVILLATMINHPALFSEYEERFCTMTIADEALDRMRQEIILTLEEETELDIFDLRGHLDGCGFGSDLKRVLNDSVYTHAGFARPSADIDAARNGWTETWEFMIKKQKQHELHAAARALSEDMSDENYQRWQSLYQQQAQEQNESKESF